ncbi:hypothetical protein AQUCO_00700763v1 [Aquilegia coerulea]|uniref:F-box domain-containing protein n=1 Tax=Aquilegia coerulea TaxID=218851 RepID=A0A2G5EM29_AQUCA|nr:hypothetical protein AQUCO_00700763v1 [Aquilegia coerulea]
MALWSELPNDLLCLIGKKLDIVADRCRFRSVCKSWRFSLCPFPQPPWLMLSESQLELLQPSETNKRDEEKEDNKEEEEEYNYNSRPPLRGFVGIGGGEQQQQVIYEIELPEAHQMRCVGSTGNWLITVGKSSMIHLLNPISRVQIDLPNQSTFEYGFEYGSDDEGLTPEWHRDGLLRKIILSSTPSSSSCKDYIVMAIHHPKRKLAIARPGDASWTTVETPVNLIEDIIFFKNQFYAVNCVGVVMVCDIGDGLDSPKASTVIEKLPKTSYWERKYLVECLGELLLVVKCVLNLNGDYEEEKEIKLPAYQTEKFDVYKLDFTNRKWEQVNSLGEYCLFLGFNTSVSVPAVNYSESLKKNCIYFTDDFTIGYRGLDIPGGSDMGVFDMEDKSIQPHYKGESTCYYSPPLWLIPTLPVK